MKIVFFGSSHFSLYALKACLQSKHTVVMIISTPPQKQGRGLKERPSVIQEAAGEYKVPCLVPENLKSPEILEQINGLKPDLFVVSSYGKMIPSSWLKVPAILPLNVHPSLLPKYRGAAPTNWPILNGDPETGMSIAEVTPKLDAGDVFYQKRIPLEDKHTSESLEKYLGELSGPALMDVFQRIESGKLARTVQDETKTCYARKLSKEDGKIDWSRSAKELFNQIRGLLPWPTAFFVYKGESVQVLQASYQEGVVSVHKPGQVTAVDNKQGRVSVQVGHGILSLETVKPAGKKEMTAAEFIRGRRIDPGASLNS